MYIHICTEFQDFQVGLNADSQKIQPYVTAGHVLSFFLLETRDDAKEDFSVSL